MNSNILCLLEAQAYQKDDFRLKSLVSAVNYKFSIVNWISDKYISQYQPTFYKRSCIPVTSLENHSKYHTCTQIKKKKPICINTYIDVLMTAMWLRKRYGSCSGDFVFPYIHTVMNNILQMHEISSEAINETILLTIEIQKSVTYTLKPP